MKMPRRSLLRLWLVVMLAIVLVMAVASVAYACLVAGGGGSSSSMPYTETTHAPETWEAQRIGQFVVN